MGKIHWEQKELALYLETLGNLSKEKFKGESRKLRKVWGLHTNQWGSLLAIHHLRKKNIKRKMGGKKRKKLLLADDILAQKALALGYDNYLTTERWLKLSLLARERAENRCQICNGGGILQAHHRTYRRLLTDFEEKDLICLCKKCHRLYHNI